MHLQFLQRLFTHMEWADALVWRSVLEEEVVSADDYVLDSLVHLHLVQHAYMSVWNGETVATPTPSRDDFAGLADILDWARPFYPAAAEFLAGLTEERLGETIPIPWTRFIEKEIGGPPSPADLGDMVFQVAAHSVHHRAQISRRIREVGGSPSMVDYIGWVWRGSPAPDWSR